MTADHETAKDPNDLARFFIARGNAGDAAGLAALYTEDAVLDVPGARTLCGRAEILAFYEQFVASRPVLEPGEQRPALVSGDLALTSTKLKDGSVTAEVARRGPDGAWQWVVDQPQID